MKRPASPHAPPGKLWQVIGDILQPTHLLFILVVALLVLGPKRLPEVGRSLGRGLRDFRDAMSGEDRRDEVPRYTSPPEEPPPSAPSYTDPTSETTTPSYTDVESHPASETTTPASEPSDAELVSEPPVESAPQASEPEERRTEASEPAGHVG